MRYKFIVALLLVVAAIGVVATAVPAAAADAGSSMTYDGPGGYQITITKVAPTWSSSSGLVRAMAGSSTITQGQYKYHGRNINYYTTSADFNLVWGNPSNSLRLRLVTPDSYVLGPFFDSVDGSINGVVSVRITRSGGLAQGIWEEEVYGYSVSGTQSYNIN